MGMRRDERTSHVTPGAGLKPPNPASANAPARAISLASTMDARRARIDAGRVSRRASVGYYDHEGRFLYATPALAAYMGMTPDQLIGRTWYEIGVPPEAVQALEETRRRVLETGLPANQKTSLQVGGKRRETEFVIKPVIGRDGSIEGTVVVAWDASEDGRSSRGKARINRSYLILRAIDEVITRARNSSVILSEACRIAARLAQDHAAVASSGDDFVDGSQNQVAPVDPRLTTGRAPILARVPGDNNGPLDRSVPADHGLDHELRLAPLASNLEASLLVRGQTRLENSPPGLLQGLDRLGWNAYLVPGSANELIWRHPHVRGEGRGRVQEATLVIVVADARSSRDLARVY